MKSIQGLNPVAAAMLGLVLAAPALAQEAQRIEITGSSIKRIEGETALPVQTIRREDIDKSGATTAAEVLRNISAASANLADGASITDSTGGQRGFNGANLRGIGVSSTLVLLNGRRLANFASPGDAAGVDLNNIPAGAIERVEVLKDGASAIYGTDAIGGVINFITRRDWQGVDLRAYVAGTQDGGAGKKAGTIGAGFGDITKDGFNVFGVLDVQQLDALRSSQRDFIAERPLNETLPFYLSSRTSPANIRFYNFNRTAATAAVNAAGYTFDGAPFTNRTINLAAPGCNPPATVYAADFESQACGYDYMQDTEIYPDSEKLSFLGRGVLRLGADMQLFAEAMVSRTKTKYVLSPNPTTFEDISLRVLGSHLVTPIDSDEEVQVRWRTSAAGNRSNRVSSDGDRIVVGVSGMLSPVWDYTLAASRAANKTVDRYVDGYFLYSRMEEALRDGTVNPFGPQSAAGQALIDSIRVDDAARRSRGSTTGIDAKVTGTFGTLAGGDIGVALGAELRRERQEFTPSTLLNGNDIAGDRDSSGTSPPIEATSNGRKIGSAFAEANLPFTKQLELQLALRHDKYEGIGSTTNPKLGVRWQPAKTVLVRGSAGTGFRAPTFSELYRPRSFGSSPAFVYDPVIDDFDQWPTVKEANPDLKPEKSRQFSFGLVLEPLAGTSFSIDYWNIKKKDVISALTEKTILGDPVRYANYITRDEDDVPTILLRKENQGRLKTSGIDVEASWRGAPSPIGRFGATLSGTYVIDYERQFGPLEPYVSNVGKFLNDQVIQRWRHRVGFDWDLGAFGVSLGNSFYSGYTDDSYLPDTAPRKVKAYSLWDLSGTWSPTKNLKLRAGILNLLDTDPPFSNQSYYFLSTYDPTYTDPRGRTFHASVNYSFK